MFRVRIDPVVACSILTAVTFFTEVSPGGGKNHLFQFLRVKDTQTK